MSEETNEELYNPMADKYLPMTSVKSGKEHTVARGVHAYTNKIVNICTIEQHDNNNNWVLVDTGMPKSSDKVIQTVEDLYGTNNKPNAIILTHGHFDHVGTVVELVKKWNVPVYAHPEEMPYLTGKKAYPKADSSVDRGLVAKMSPRFPNEPVNLGDFVQPLPSDGSVPELGEWKWLHTPGHTPGHISLFREHDRTLIAGDAFVTVKQESLSRVTTQKLEIHGPPKYLTMDWVDAKSSVEKLNQLEPAAAITGHGMPVRGSALQDGLQKLADNFDTAAVPETQTHDTRQ